MACERPELRGRSLSQWDCRELADQLVREGRVDSISPSTVRAVLSAHKLKPWRHHMWLGAKRPRDAEFYERVENVIGLYTRPLAPDEAVLCLDQKTSLQPRIRPRPTKPARPGSPNLLEHEYKRDGALQLFAAFDTRTGKVYGATFGRKRQAEFIAFLEQLDAEIPDSIATVHLVLDNLSVHSGKQALAWLDEHPRFRIHFTPVHCSWMNQIEQWFGILQRKRFRLVDFLGKADLAAKIARFVAEWNEHAHPFNWSTESVAKVMAEAPGQRLAA